MNIFYLSHSMQKPTFGQEWSERMRLEFNEVNEIESPWCFLLLWS